MKRKLKEKGRENEGGRKLRNENLRKIVKVKIRRESKNSVSLRLSGTCCKTPARFVLVGGKSRARLVTGLVLNY